MKTLMNGMLTAGLLVLGSYVAPPQLAAQRSGVEVWSQTCGHCHNIQPAARYTAGNWESILTHMQIVARLTDDEAEAVLEFLKGGAKPLASAEPAEDPEVLASLASAGPLAVWPAAPNGAELFTKECVACHGETGAGNGPVANALDPRPADLTASVIKDASDETLAEAIADGKGTMPAFGGRLSSEQIAAVVKYVRQLQSRGDQ